MIEPRARPATFGVVLLTMGRRPKELLRAIASVDRQRGVGVDLVVVGNGWQPVGLPEHVRAVSLAQNVGIPAGRNAGVPHVSGEFLLFLDDDSWLIDEDFLSVCAERFRQEPSLGLIQPRIVDPDRPGAEPTRWIPRIRKGHPAERSYVFSVLETATVLKRQTFEAVGGWPDEFFYAHEGIELAWRVWDQNLTVRYLGDLQVGHPVVAPTRHPEYYYMNARNRVWVAKRCLPWPISWWYVMSWTLIHLLRTRNRRETRPWWLGWWAGWRQSPWKGEPVRPLRWSTILRMTRLGRPPIV